jgi:FkbM family methyltransferase
VFLLGFAKLNLLPQLIWKRLPVEKEFHVSLPDGKTFIYSSVANDAIGRALYWGGLQAFEPETTQIFYKLAQNSNLIIDVGANTGVFSLLACAANQNCCVVSFEPVPRIFDRLAHNIKLNGWENRCQVRSEAVSNITGCTKLHVPYGILPTSASLNIQGFRGLSGYLLDVPVVTLDKLCLENGKVDLVKIDVEGFEDKVLEGMQRILARFAPTIIIECHLDGPILAVESILKQVGYHLFHLCSKGPVAVKKITPDAKEKYRNYICTIQGCLDGL